MSLIDNIFSNLGLLEGACSFRIILLGEVGGYFEGVKKILSFTSTQVILLFGKERYCIEGEGFKIKKYCSGDLCLLGKIKAVTKND